MEIDTKNIESVDELDFMKKAKILFDKSVVKKDCICMK